jgi:hypothetical protein
VLARDFDGDGAVDLLLLGAPNLLLRNGGAGTFAVSSGTLPASSAVQDAVAGDLDGDGVPTQSSGLRGDCSVAQRRRWHLH